jgi:ubiquinone/menaquinone biosynthesis C-methylase UbiE
MNAAVHQNVLPVFPVSGRTVLDVGCADGATLMHPAYQKAQLRCGIDVDAEAVALGTLRYPALELKVASAESLPYPSDTFDVVISKVSILFTDIRKSLAEMYRVMKFRGDLLLTLHDWHHQAYHFTNAVKARAFKRVLDHAYIVPASVVYMATGRVIARPWNGRRETFQSAGSLRRDLRWAGFSEIEIKRTARDFIVTANKGERTTILGGTAR